MTPLAFSFSTVGVDVLDLEVEVERSLPLLTFVAAVDREGGFPNRELDELLMDLP